VQPAESIAASAKASPEDGEQTSPDRSRSTWSELIAEARGGFVSAAFAAPLAIGFGMFAFVGLGDEFFGHGVLAGLVGAIVAGLVCVLMNDRTGVLHAPSVVTSFFIGTLILQHVAQAEIAIVRDGGSAAVLALVFAIVFVAGAIQLVFGLTRVGTLIRYIPQPVVAGFQNGAALLLVIAQLGQVLGLDSHVRLDEVLDHMQDTKPLSVLVAVVAALATWHARRWVTRMPPLLFGLAAGTVAFYAIAGIVGRSTLGPALGTVPGLDTLFVNPGALMQMAHHSHISEALPIILSGAAAVAIIASVDALLCSRMLESTGARRTPTDVQLARLGTANMAAACVGGITAGPNLDASLVNRAFGGRSRTSVLINACVMLLLIVAALPLIAYLPRAALSGVLIVIGIQHVDRWSLGIARQVAARDGWRARSRVFDLIVVVLVAGVAILVDLMSAVAFGLALSVLYFIARMSRSVVRRIYRANAARSRKSRAPKLMAFLAERGATILIVELDGAVFFGTAEHLADRLEQELAQETRYVILDFKRVNEVDSTGAEVIRQLSTRLAERKADLFICGVLAHSAFYRVLQDSGIVGTRGSARSFVDLDRAIEGAEQALIDAECDPEDRPGNFPLGALPLLQRMDRTEMAEVRQRLTRRTYAAQQVVFDQGDAGEALFIVVAGNASARMLGDGRERRLMTFGPGGIFGEMGFLERSTRSAAVVADEELQCLVLDRLAFDDLAQAHPGIAIKLLSALGRELSTRLRLVNRTILQLET